MINSLTMITIVHVMFIPDEYNFYRFKKSITSILNSDLTDVDNIIVDGWCRNDRLWVDVENLLRGYKIVELNRRSTNIGKSTIVNENKIYTPLVIYSDSDIVVEVDTIQRLKRLTSIYDIVIPDQLEDCRHYKLLFDQHINVIDEEVYSINRPEGIAGGFLMMKASVVDEIKFKNKGPYGSDDVEFFQQVLSKYSMCVCKSISVVHPFYIDIKEKEYHDWKVKMSLSGYLKNLTNDEINDRINESVKFWS